MPPLGPILKSRPVLAILAGSAVAFAVLVVTDGSAPAHVSGAKPQARPRDGPDRAPSWHGEIAFAVPTSTSGTDAELVEVAAEERTEPSVVYRAPPGQTIRDLAWSPDGARLAVVVGTPIGAGHVLTMSGTGDDIREVTRGRKVSTASVAWSPDGRRLVYDLGQAGHPERGQPLIVSRADGARAHRITPPHGLAVAPAWSPDGRLIAYVKPYAPGESARRTGSIRVIPAAGGASRGVSAVYDGHEPSWAADSRTVSYAANWEGGQGLVSVALHHDATPYLAFDCTAVLRCDTIGSLSAAPGEGALGFLVTVDHPARALVSVTRFGSTTGSVPLLRLPLYTCCMTWAPPAPGQTAV
jgi:hypothetical protein